MTGTDPSPGADCSLDRYPGPALAYDIEADQALLRGRNDAFTDAFGSVAIETPLSECFDRLGLTPVDGSGEPLEPVPDALARKQQVAVRVTGAETLSAGDGDASGTAEEYLLSVVPPAGSAPGYLLFARATHTDEIGVDSVASVVSHDLRNPLDVAKARLRAARETGEAEHFEYVADAHDRMERIVEDVLTLARGEEVIDPTAEVDLRTVVETAWETVDTVGASLTVEGELPTVIADENRARRLFENLFRNSVEHGSTGSRTRSDDGVEHGDEPVTVVVGRLPDATGVYVADDGPGIPAEEREAVLDPGYSTHDHGTGLGLAIVRRIADGHDWTVRVAEAADGGARIELSGMASPESTNE